MTKHPRAHHEYGDVCLLLDCRFDVFDMFQGDSRVDLCEGVMYALTFFRQANDSFFHRTV